MISLYKESTSGNGHQGHIPLAPASPSTPGSTSCLPTPPTSAPSFNSYFGNTQIPQSQPVWHDLSFFNGLVPEYMNKVYPVNPIITEAEVQESINLMNHDRQHRAFVLAFAAVTICLTRVGSKSSPEAKQQMVQLAKQAIEMRGPLLPNDPITIRNIMISSYAHVCFTGGNSTDHSFFYLREAITMVQMLRIDSPDTKFDADLSRRARKQRLYWEMFVHERYSAIADYRPVILKPLDRMPELDPNLPLGVHDGFCQIIKLFQLVDGDFLQNWLNRQQETSVTDSAWIEKKQEELNRELDKSEIAAVMGSLTELQQADLLITRQWLRTVVWQMAMSQCLLSSMASKSCMSLLFPVGVSRQLRRLLVNMTPEAIEVHGSGIYIKLFELTNTIADVIILIPAASLDETSDRLDDFLFLLRFLLDSSHSDAVRSRILQEKLEKLQSLFPPGNTQIDGRAPAGQQEPLQTASVVSPTPPGFNRNLSNSSQDSQLDPWLRMTRSMMPPRSEFATESTPDSEMSRDDPYYQRHGGGPPLPPIPVEDPNMRWQNLTRELRVAPPYQAT